MLVGEARVAVWAVRVRDAVRCFASEMKGHLVTDWRLLQKTKFQSLK